MQVVSQHFSKAVPRVLFLVGLCFLAHSAIAYKSIHFFSQQISNNHGKPLSSSCHKLCQRFSDFSSNKNRRSSHVTLNMVGMDSTLNSLTRVLLPVCIEATSKTTTVNDPLAGMDDDQITSYMSDIGGGLCGIPEGARTAIGIALNANLLLFGVLVVTYAVASIVNAVLEKQVDDTFKDQAQRIRAQGGAQADFLGRVIQATGIWSLSNSSNRQDAGSNQTGSSRMAQFKGVSSEDQNLNREERRLKRRK